MKGNKYSEKNTRLIDALRDADREALLQVLKKISGTTAEKSIDKIEQLVEIFKGNDKKIKF
jgi:hypothetical protein